MTEPTPPGYNPMRWDCERDGCFNKKLRPKIEVFCECFPGRGSFGDVDGLVEINSHFCLLEWKTGNTIWLPRGQELCYERFSKVPWNVVLVAGGNAETIGKSTGS